MVENKGVEWTVMSDWKNKARKKKGKEKGELYPF